MAKMAEVPLRIMNGMKCLACISEYVEAEQKGEEPPEIRDAITLAPQWVTQSTLGQMVMACVAVPSCMDHLTVKEKTPEEKAVEGGIVLGRAHPNGG